MDGDPAYDRAIDELIKGVGQSELTLSLPAVTLPQHSHFPGILQRFNQLLPNAIDMADTGSIPQLLDLGQQFARDWIGEQS